MNNKYALPILLYDDQCPLCRRFSESLGRVETTPITKVSIHDNNIYHVFPELSEDHCQLDVHYITPERKVLVGAMVVDHLIRQYPMVKKFSWLMDSEIGKRSVDLFYSATSRLRRNIIGCKRCGH
ncbi:MAG: DUF393 domain-containing protein [Bacteriovoracaceae bacterium]|nr:DUF393 domain-containing protein [Bacteriovoracaceae bacterium]